VLQSQDSNWISLSPSADLDELILKASRPATILAEEHRNVCIVWRWTFQYRFARCGAPNAYEAKR